MLRMALTVYTLHISDPVATGCCPGTGSNITWDSAACLDFAAVTSWSPSSGIGHLLSLTGNGVSELQDMFQ